MQTKLERTAGDDEQAVVENVTRGYGKKQSRWLI